MRAMILAAGRGERMGEKTAAVPKPLLKVGNHYLIEYAIANIKRAGIKDIVINVAYMADLIQKEIGQGKRYGLNIEYSVEAHRLEVGGGIYNALPLLGEGHFIVVSADVITDYPLDRLLTPKASAAHLILVRNPIYHTFGDFGLREDGYIDLTVRPKFTFANVGLYHTDLFANCKPGFYPWREVMWPHLEAGVVTGELYEGLWYNIGTPQDLLEINERAREDATLQPY